MAFMWTKQINFLKGTKAPYYTAKQDSSDKVLLDHIFHRNKIYHLISEETK